MAGADLVATNTFNSTSISQADYGMQSLVPELNREAARLCREACRKAQERDGRRRFVVGSLGPTSRTASISPDVNNPGFRAVSFDELHDAYVEATRALIEGGAEIIIIETIFDTLNAKAAFAGVETVFSEIGQTLPVMISGTITDLSGRTLSGQTPTAFWHSMQPRQPFSIGLNCALGAREMRAHLAELSRVADTLICAYPNAGLPNEFGLYDESPEYMAGLVKRVRRGRPRQHPRRLLRHDAAAHPRHRAGGQGRQAARGAGHPADAAAVRAGAVRAHARHQVRERRRAHQRHGLGPLPQADQGGRPFGRARRRARPGRQRRADHRHQHGRGPARLAEGDGRVPQPRSPPSPTSPACR